MVSTVAVVRTKQGFREEQLLAMGLDGFNQAVTGQLHHLLEHSGG